jgi:hypothetical protein
MRRIFFLVSSSWLIVVYAQRLEGPIDVNTAQWQPVSPGKWTVSTKRFEAGHEQASSAAPMQDTISACPYPSLLFLRSHASVKLGEPGCQFLTYRLTKNEYHIVARCRTLSGTDHYETTTLTVSTDGKGFSSATTWTERTASITVRREGVWSATCGKEQH